MVKTLAGKRPGGLHRYRCAHLPLAGLLVLWMGTGCARTITFTVHEHINTAIHRDRDPKDRTGEPLEVNIVCVYPSDLDKTENAPLMPDANITSEAWYRFRPVPGHTGGGGRFSIPAKQIYVLSDDQTVFGVRKGKALRGYAETGKKKIKVTGIEFKGSGRGTSLFNKRAVLYVFPKFIGPTGEVLPVLPARFDPPGHFRRDLYVEIGVKDPAGRAEQFIKNTTVRKAGRSGQGG